MKKTKNLLEMEFLGVIFKSPLILPSGIIQELSGYNLPIENGVGGVVGKSLTVMPREGNPLPRVVKYKDIGFLNSVGLRNKGINEGTKELAKFIKTSRIPVIASIFAVSVSDFVSLSKKVLKANPAFIELNLSCPNTTSELGKPLGMGVRSTSKTVKAVRRAIGDGVKIIAKLSPNVQDIKKVAKAAERSGADAISAINTVGPGMLIDIQKRKPILGNKEGGMSGPCIKPVAVRCVYDIYEAVNIPIIGMGGISTWEDTVEMMMAGASVVGVGSAWYNNKNVYKDINKGLISYISKEELSSLKEIVGIAHPSYGYN